MPSKRTPNKPPPTAPSKGLANIDPCGIIPAIFAPVNAPPNKPAAVFLKTGCVCTVCVGTGEPKAPKN